MEIYPISCPYGNNTITPYTMQYSQKGSQWFAEGISRISFLNDGYGRSTQSLSGHIAGR